MSTGHEYIGGAEERIFDLTSGVLIAGATLPLAWAAGAISLLDSRSLDPYFQQERVGQGGDPFFVTKYRSIHADRTQGELTTHETNDPRATDAGQFLRTYGLDELPGLVQVIDGTMSMVGIRPKLRQTIEGYQTAAPEIFPAWWAAYTHGKPGITGLSQIFRKSAKYRTMPPEAQARRSMLLDLRYHLMASRTLDRLIVLRTPRELVRGKFEERLAATALAGFFGKPGKNTGLSLMHAEAILESYALLPCCASAPAPPTFDKI